MLTRKRKPEEQSENDYVKINPSAGITKRHRKLKQKLNRDWEELQPLTIETSVCDESGATLIRYSQINLLSHCVFCLRKTTTTTDQSNQEDVSSKELLEDVPRASFLGSSSSQLLSTFNRIWAYLGKGKKGVEFNADPLLHVLEESERVSIIGKSRTSFLDLPRMCVPCAANLQTVHRLFTELRAQLDGIEKIIKDSKYSGKYPGKEHFEKYLTSSNLEQVVITSTLDILDNPERNGDNLMNHSATGQEGAKNNVTVNSKPEPFFAPESVDFLPEFPPVANLQSFADSIESETQPEHKFSGYVEVPSADSNYSGDFVDEDDDWDGNATDHDSIKSEAEDDFKEEEDSSDEDEYLEELTPPKTRSGLKPHKEISIQLESGVKIKIGNGGDASTRRLQGETRDKSQICELCKQTVPINNIGAHVRDHVGKEFVIPCPNPTCQYTFSKPYSRYLHLVTHKVNDKRCSESVSKEFLEMAKYTKCQECGHKLGDRRSVKTHLLHVHEDATKNFSCPIDGCYEQFTARQSVQFHIETHQLKSASRPSNHLVNTQTCSQCNSTFSLEEMANHLKEAHGVGAEEVVKCSHCSFLFTITTREHLVDHLFQHRSSVLSCDICGSQVKFSDLREHYGSVHNVGKRFPCEHCEYGAWTRNGLEQHIEKEHERHQCDQCTKSFSIYNGLEKHKEEVHGHKLVQGFRQTCDLCRKKVPLTDMRTHAREHVGDEYLISCPKSECPYAFTKPYSLYSHLRIHKHCRESVSNLEEVLEMTKARKCHECDYQASKSLTLRHHLLREHETSAKNFSCPIENCTQKFTVKQSVQFHIATHKTRREPQPLTTQKCTLCDSTFELEKMETHLKNTHGAQEVVNCAHCPFVFSTREHLVDHLYEHRKSVLSCDICGDQAQFTRHVRLAEHYFSAHNVGKRFPCEHCSFVCSSRRNWMLHMRSKHKKENGENGDIIIKVPAKQTINRRAYKCHVNDCEAAYSCLSDLKDHKIKVHGAEPYSCEICSATFPARKHLARHEKEHAGATSTFACEVKGCGKSFHSNFRVKRHMATAHQGERPHVCELCGKSYRQKTGLNEHKKAVHLGIRSYVCDTCGESFTNGSVLKRHKLIHTGERPFGCEICGQRFRHREVLKTHVEGHRKKGADFKPNGPMKQVRKRVEIKSSTSKTKT